MKLLFEDEALAKKMGLYKKYKIQNYGNIEVNQKMTELYKEIVRKS